MILRLLSASASMRTQSLAFFEAHSLDKCGHMAHLIFNYKGGNILKTSDVLFKQDSDGTSHLYALIVQLL